MPTVFQIAGDRRTVSLAAQRVVMPVLEATRNRHTFYNPKCNGSVPKQLVRYGKGIPSIEFRPRIGTQPVPATVPTPSPPTVRTARVPMGVGFALGFEEAMAAAEEAREAAAEAGNLERTEIELVVLLRAVAEAIKAQTATIRQKVVRNEIAQRAPGRRVTINGYSRRD